MSDNILIFPKKITIFVVLLLFQGNPINDKSNFTEKALLIKHLWENCV